MTINELLNLKLFSGYDVALETDKNLYKPTRFNPETMGNYEVVKILAMRAPRNRNPFLEKLMIIISNTPSTPPKKNREVTAQAWCSKSLTWEEEKHFDSLAEFEKYFDNLEEKSWIDEINVIGESELYIQISKEK